MSMTHFTVKQLKEFIKDLPDNMMVVTKAGEVNWIGEGMFDGLEPYITDRLWEIRTGFIPSDLQCTYGKVLVLSDLNEEDNIEWWNQHVEASNLHQLKVEN